MTIFGTKETTSTALENAIALMMDHAELIAATGAPAEIVEAQDAPLAAHDHGGSDSWNF